MRRPLPPAQTTKTPVRAALCGRPAPAPQDCLLRGSATIIAIILLVLVQLPSTLAGRDPIAKVQLRVGVAAVPITPFGPNPDWDGTVTGSGVWGENYQDLNHNGKWDPGEPFEDDPRNSALDPSSRGKYDGIYLAGFGHNRPATGKHDDLWARAIVLDSGPTRIAIVSLDLIGYYSDANYYGLGEIRKLVDPKLGITDILITSTHDHEAPDTIGAWGSSLLSDGKYPEYLRFVDRSVAKAITLAASNTIPARVKLGRTDPQHSPSIAGLQTRTHGRPPDFFDDELRVIQFVASEAGARDKVIATLINWNTHPESMESQNTLITSDFPDAVRRTVELRYGGIAVYVSGDLGAVEIIGDSNNKKSDRTRFDGKDFPIKPERNRPDYSFERTEAIGRDVARAAADAIDQGEWTSSDLSIKKAKLSALMDNDVYMLLADKGVLDTMPAPSPGTRPMIHTFIYDMRLGDAEIMTVPGELLPEVFYGVEKHHRADCAQADTGRPKEPSVRDRMAGKYKFIFGLCPDEFGYIVPGYDFLKPSVDLAKGRLTEAADPCKTSGAPDHYHETNSASSMLAPAWSCAAATLLEGKVPEGVACRQFSDRNQTEPKSNTPNRK
jgi:hypothetical protein